MAVVTLNALLNEAEAPLLSAAERAALAAAAPDILFWLLSEGFAVDVFVAVLVLVLVLVFGLAVNNASLILRGPRLQRWLHPEQLAAELHPLKSITAESAFLIRTFFFLLFGFSITLSTLISGTLLLQGLLIVAVLTVIRYLYLRFVAKSDLIPELFIAPKGLITVLLFYSIPAHHHLGEVGESLLFVVILLTGVMMMIGLQLTKKEPQIGEY